MQGNSWTSANAVPVSGFGVHLAESLAGLKETAGPLQMVCLSRGFCVHLAETLAGCKETAHVRGFLVHLGGNAGWVRGNSWTSANAVAVRGFCVHLGGNAGWVQVHG